MTQNKSQILAALREQFERWEALLNELDEGQRTERFASGWTIKDVMAHLMVWQQRSIARIEAGLHNREPVYPPWPENIPVEEEEPVDEVNAWIFARHRDRPWQDVYRDWRNGFLRLIELAEAVPEAELLEAGKFTWLDGASLADVLTGSTGHHEEHDEMLQEWMREEKGPGANSQ